MTIWNHAIGPSWANYHMNFHSFVNCQFITFEQTVENSYERIAENNYFFHELLIPSQEQL